jgi:hypothetical protein
MPIIYYNGEYTRQQQQGNTMITIQNATVETLDQNQARPIGKTMIKVTIGDHTFDLLVDESELIDALASQYK